MAAAATLTFYDTPLFKLISATFPELRTRQGVFGVEKLALALGMSNEGVYKWFRGNKISPAGAQKVVELSKDPNSGEFRLKIEDLYPFCFPA